MSEKIFVDGFISRDIPDTTPDFILGKCAMHVDKLSKFLSANKKYAKDGWLDVQILRSKEKKTRYAELDLWSYNKRLEQGSSLPPDVVAEIKEARETEQIQQAANKLAASMDEAPF